MSFAKLTIWVLLLEMLTYTVLKNLVEALSGESTAFKILNL